MSLVNLKYEDLVAGADLTNEIAIAYGPDGAGVLTVSGIPNVLEFRKKLLTCARSFATLSDEVKEKYVHEKSNFSFGWSHGKEIFNNKQDVLKGSYYANPQYDVPTEDQKLIDKYPFLLSQNIWPKDELPELESSFKAMGCLMVEVALLIAKQVDNYVNKIYGGEAKNYHNLYNVIKNSKVAKGRLLYYFPMQKEQIETQLKDKSLDSWCGLHLDHGSLTGLTNALYCDENGNPIENFSDETAGLHIITRKGEVIKAKWPSDCLAFQIGESAQIHSGGRVIATPHLVRGTVQPNVSRSTFALFMQPQWDESMVPPQGSSIQDCKVDVLEEGMDFNEFTNKRINLYYGKM